MATPSEQSKSPALLNALRIAMVVQLLVGIALWTGHGYALRNFHMAVGMLFVLLLWTIAIRAFARRHRVPLAVFALVWGLVIPALGMMQQRLLIGDLHWIVRLLHLAVGVAAMPMAGLLSAPTPTSHHVSATRTAA